MADLEEDFKIEKTKKLNVINVIIMITTYS
jgi:hypothetical protein